MFVLLTHVLLLQKVVYNFFKLIMLIFALFFLLFQIKNTKKSTHLQTKKINTHLCKYQLIKMSKKAKKLQKNHYLKIRNNHKLNILAILVIVISQKGKNKNIHRVKSRIKIIEKSNHISFIINISKKKSFKKTNYY